MTDSEIIKRLVQDSNELEYECMAYIGKDNWLSLLNEKNGNMGTWLDFLYCNNRLVYMIVEYSLRKMIAQGDVFVKNNVPVAPKKAS